MTSAINQLIRIPGYGRAFLSKGGAAPRWYNGLASQMNSGGTPWRWALGDHEIRPATRHTVKSPSGWRDPKSWSHTHERCELPDIAVTARYWYEKPHTTKKIWFDQWWISPVVITGYPPPLPPIGSLENKAVNQALQRLSDQRTDLGTNFAERQQAERMIADRVGQIEQSVRRFKDRRPNDWRKARKLKWFGPKRLGAIPNAWLELQYGWNPLMQDVKGAYDFMRNIDKENDSFRFQYEAVSERNPTLRSGRILTITPRGPTWPLRCI